MLKGYKISKEKKINTLVKCENMNTQKIMAAFFKNIQRNDQILLET